MNKETVIGIDLGATNIRGACVNENTISEIKSQRIRSNGTEQQVLEDAGDQEAAVGVYPMRGARAADRPVRALAR